MIGGEPRRRQVPRRPEVARDDRPGGEALGVVRDGVDVLIARGQPGAAEPVRVRDRAALPQVVLDRVGVGGPCGIEVGEVGRPVADRAGYDLAAGAGGPAAAPAPAVFGESVIRGHVRLPRSARLPARAVRRRKASVTLPSRRHAAVARDRSVALVVLAEQVGRDVVAAAVALAAAGADLHLHRTFPSPCRSTGKIMPIDLKASVRVNTFSTAVDPVDLTDVRS